MVHHLCRRCVESLRDRLAADEKWEEHGLAFASAVGRPLDAANVRRVFRQALRDVDGIDADEWTPRKLRHRFVTVLSDPGRPAGSDLPDRRVRRDRRDGKGLPEADPAGDPAWCAAGNR